MTDPAKIFINNAMEFINHNHGLNQAQQVLGGSFWGILRALLECENCPGNYRIPCKMNNIGELEPEEPFGKMEYLYCPNCKQSWKIKNMEAK